MLWLLVVFVLLGTWLLLARVGGSKAVAFGFACSVAGALSFGVRTAGRAPSSISAGSENAVRVEPLASEVGSEACKSCHPSAYESFHRSFHRSMTRRPVELAWDGVDGPTLPVRLEREGAEYELERESDGTLSATGPDLHWLASALFQTRGLVRRESSLLEQAPRVKRELVLVTGSHHYSTFWIRGDEGREMRLFPFVFWRGAGGAPGTWLERNEVFITPPGEPLDIPAWNSNCIQCHAVSGRPGQSESHGFGVYETRATDLGIACEACHGPGRRHVEEMSSPFRRAATRRRDSEHEAANDDPSIVHPRRLDAARSSALCGQCHAYFVPNDPEEWWRVGTTEKARPEIDYAEARSLLTATDQALAERSGLSRDLSSIFWGDGTMRVGGREYNGLLESPCFERGTGERRLGCLSCHSLHRGEPDHQLDPDKKQGVDFCVSCHETESRDAAHSGHAPGSPGADCLGCHMPSTTYALLDGLVSHRIVSPNHRLADPPSPCALCHVTESASWIHDQLDRLFPSSRSAARRAEDEPRARADRDDEPLGARTLLAGNAAERAIFARALVRPGARALVGDVAARTLLERLLDDPYAAVRRIARRSLEDRSRASSRGPASTPLDVPFEATQLDAWEAERDDTPLVISE